MKKALPIITVLCTFLFQTNFILGQEEKQTLYLDRMMQEIEQGSAVFKMELRRVGGDRHEGIIYDYAGAIKAKGSYVKFGKKYLEDAHFTFYFQNGQIESEGEYDLGIKVGYWKRYDSKGNRKTDRYYPTETADRIRESMKLNKVEEEK